MKRVKVLLASFGFVFALGVPALVTASVSAATDCDGPCVSNLQCSHDPDEHGDVCDISILKEVSVNGGAFSDANDEADAVSAHVGDTVTWRITVTNVSSTGFTPGGEVFVDDILPIGVTYVSSSASDGSTYNPTNSFSNWGVLLNGATYPVVLTITSTASTTGSYENTATFDHYESPQCFGQCDGLSLTSSESSHHNDSAWVNIQTPPQVLGATTTSDPQVLGLTDTGSGMGASIAAGLLIVSTAGVLVIGRRRSSYKV